MPPLQGQWLEALKPEFKKPYYKELSPVSLQK